MKKILAILLAAAITFSFSACGGGEVVSNSSGTDQEDTSSPGEDTDSSEEGQSSGDAEETEEGGEDGETVDLANAPVGGQIVIGYADTHQNDWMFGWTSNASQFNIRTLLGQSQYADVYALTREGTMEVNKAVVEDIQSVVNDDASKTWTVKLKDGLLWSDGEKLTAEDYLFNSMMRASPNFGELQGDNTAHNDLIGFDAYNKGETKTFAGLHLIDELTFSVTASGEKLPYHWEFNLVNLGPLPMHKIAPGVELTDSPEGLTISDAFTTDLLRETLLNQDTGYRYHPDPSCGPYKFESFDAAANEVTIVINDKFFGTYDGVKPHVQKVICKTVSSDTVMDALRTGSIDAYFGTGNKERIETGLDMEEEGLVYSQNYFQNGYNNWKLQCDFGPTQFKAVRQALAYLMNRDEVMKQTSGSYGKVTDGYYSLGQFEYQERGENLESKLTHYTFDPAKAKELLIADGWTKNATGGDFVEGTDEVRYKEVDGALMPLEINLLGQAGKGLDLERTMTPPEAAKVGMKLTIAPMDWAAMMEQVQRTTGAEPQYHGFAMAIGFSATSEYWYEYATDPGYLGIWNLNYIDSPEIKAQAEKMKKIPMEDQEAWLDAWEEFQVIWNDQLPDIPTSSILLFNFINTKVKNANVNGVWQFKYDIPYMYVQE